MYFCCTFWTLSTYHSVHGPFHAENTHIAWNPTGTWKVFSDLHHMIHKCITHSSPYWCQSHKHMHAHTHPQCHTLGDTEWEAAPLCVSGTQEWREQKRNEHFESKRSLGRAAGEWAVRERLGSSMRLLLTALRVQLNLMARDGPHNCSLSCIGFLFCDIKLWLLSTLVNMIPSIFQHYSV